MAATQYIGSEITVCLTKLYLTILTPHKARNGSTIVHLADWQQKLSSYLLPGSFVVHTDWLFSLEDERTVCAEQFLERFPRVTNNYSGSEPGNYHSRNEIPLAHSSPYPLLPVYCCALPADTALASEQAYPHLACFAVDFAGPVHLYRARISHRLYFPK